MEAIRIGDIIEAKGRRVVISEIITQDFYKGDGWFVEGKDQRGKYFVWKEWSDGGNLIRCKKDNKKTGQVALPVSGKSRVEILVDGGYSFVSNLSASDIRELLKFAEILGENLA